MMKVSSSRRVLIFIYEVQIGIFFYSSHKNNNFLFKTLWLNPAWELDLQPDPPLPPLVKYGVRKKILRSLKKKLTDSRLLLKNIHMKIKFKKLKRTTKFWKYSFLFKIHASIFRKKIYIKNFTGKCFI